MDRGIAEGEAETLLTFGVRGNARATDLMRGSRLPPSPHTLSLKLSGMASSTVSAMMAQARGMPAWSASLP